MVEEFDLPQSIIDRKVTKMKMISPSNREVDVGKTLSDTEYIGMCRREVFDQFLRERAEKNGAKLVNGLMMRMEQKGAPAMRRRAARGAAPRRARVFAAGLPRRHGAAGGSPLRPGESKSAAGVAQAAGAPGHRPPSGARRPLSNAAHPTPFRTADAEGPITIHYNSYETGSKVGAGVGRRLRT
jgi:flavin-dependent dehydrogenase